MRPTLTGTAPTLTETAPTGEMAPTTETAPTGETAQITGMAPIGEIAPTGEIGETALRLLQLAESLRRLLLGARGVLSRRNKPSMEASFISARCTGLDAMV